ncbi:MAG: NADH-quinone oxidoreductase subunit N [Chloroflexia bacterium]
MTIDYSGINTNLEAILPEIIVAVFAIIVIFVDLFTRGRDNKSPLLAGVSIVGYVLAFAACVLYFNNNIGSSIFNQQAFNNMIVMDNLGLFLRMLALGTAIVATLLSIQYVKDRGLAQGEYYAMVALATCGMMFTSAATDLTTIFVGIELMSIAVYILTGFARNDKLSNEAALKYFLLGIFSTAILVYGMAWLYGMTGHTNLRLIGDTVAEIIRVGGGLTTNGGLLLAMILLIAGLGFKIAAVPFHMWTPDAYQGAPTPITAFMSVGPKAAGFAATIRIMTEALGPASAQWVPIIAVLSVLTMTLGNVTAVLQRSLKRMLAYSSIAHTGYILIGLATFTDANRAGSISSILFYLFSYLFMNLGAFGVIIWVQRNGLTDSLESFKGLSTWAPGPAGLMMLFMLSLTGIPPTLGFLGKYYVFVSAVNSGMTWLAVIGALNSAVAAFYYLRVIWFMYFEEPRTVRTQKSSPAVTYTLIGAGIAVVLFFFLSWPIIDYARNSLPTLVTTLVSGAK